MEQKNEETNAREESLILKMEKLENEGAFLKDEVERLSRMVQEYSKKIHNFSEERDEIKEKIGQNEELNQTVETLKTENEFLRNELARISQIAYCDPKFGTYNLNAFNERFFNKESDPKAVAIVDVIDMKKINQEFDEITGDNVIRCTVKGLHEVFGVENVYRIRGAQFGVILDDGDYVRIKNMLKEVADNLLEVKEFKVAYAHATVARYPSREVAFEKVKEELAGKCKENGIAVSSQEYFTTPVVKMTHNRYMQPEVFMGQEMVANEPYGSSPDKKEALPNGKKLMKIPEPVKPSNPNIAASVCEDIYAEAENIIEVDSTSIDIAYDIMNMHNRKQEGKNA